ncbi:PLP-dependent aminotransferase family protein [Paroceanicella profunda]|nr:PLP-dependent aminotransferase family protein [Paroceanicella profunda]
MNPMLQTYFRDRPEPGRSLQHHIHERLVDAILDGALPPHEPLPSSRALAGMLGVSRNTTVLVYQKLTEDGYLRPVERRGHFIHDQYIRQHLRKPLKTRTASLFAPEAAPTPWARLLVSTPSRNPNIVKPANWRDFAYPFIYGQTAADRLSLARWRDATRLTGTGHHAPVWMVDQVDADDPMLVEQILSRVLPQRGILATPDQVLVTTGSQNALYILARLLVAPGRRVGLEDPGYVDARNIFAAAGAELVPLRVDGDGLVISPALRGLDLVYVTPSHQSPTSVTLALERRLALIEAARTHDFLVIEDDYEQELSFHGAPRAAVASYDNSGRVIHVGSLTKTLFPGVRLGFVVAAPELIAEMRAYRRLVTRHPSAHDQRAMAIFIAEGHLDAHGRRLRERMSRNWGRLMAALADCLPGVHVTPTTGGSSVWCRLPEGISAWDVNRRAARRGVLVEPGDIHYLGPAPAGDRLRLGFSYIRTERIDQGVRLLAEAVAELGG